MYCMHCGVVLPEHANFCYQCGKKVEHPEKANEIPHPEPVAETVSVEECEIVYIPVQEKKGLFPKEKGRFDAITAGEASVKTIRSSTIFELGGFNLYGPQEKNPRHKAALNELIADLENEGWVRKKKTALPWYHIAFKRG